VAFAVEFAKSVKYSCWVAFAVELTDSVKLSCLVALCDESDDNDGKLDADEPLLEDDEELEKLEEERLDENGLSNKYKKNHMPHTMKTSALQRICMKYKRAQCMHAHIHMHACMNA
jgi:hypothetical protein